MPYMDSPVKEGDEWCNYKQNPDGSRGEKVGCSDTEEKAKSALRALNMAMAEENKEVTGKEVVRLTQMEVNYTSVSTTRGKACGNCRWFAKEGYEENYKGDLEEIEGGYCHQVENYPDDILSNGYCDRWEEKPGMPEPDPLPVVIVEDQRAVDDAPEPEVEYTYAVPNSNQKGFLQSLKERFSSGRKAGQSVFRDAEGRRYMFIVTSNSYEDREQETIATKALERYVDNCWVAEDYFQSNNVHQFWHHDGLTDGDIVWADMDGPFLLELAKERDDIVSKAIWDYYETTDEDLGASHRYWKRKQDKLADGTLPIISKFETTTLPRFAAANLLTYSGVIPMSKARDEYLDKLFGVEGVAEMLKEGPQKLAKALEEAGIQHKSIDEPTPEEAAQIAKDNFGALVLQMIESQADILARFDDQQAAAEQKSLAQNTRLDDLQEALKALAADNETLREEMKHSPRASQAAATTVQDDALQAEIENKSTSWDPAFPGMQVPLEK